MNTVKNYKDHIAGIIKDVFIICLLFALISFIDIVTATFITVICTAILLIRRIILDYNPGALENSTIEQIEKELIVPKGVDIFYFRNVPSMEYLYKYLEVSRGILVSTTILIIRFRGIIHINKYELDILKIALRRLKKCKITVILSDVKADVQLQLGQYEIEKEVGAENVFFTVDEAVIQANKIQKKFYKISPGS